MVENACCRRPAVDEPGMKPFTVAAFVRSNKVSSLSEEIGGMRFVRRREARVHRVG